MGVSYNITWNPVPGSVGYLVEYKKLTDSVWTTPSSSTNPTPFINYLIQLDSGTTYVVRITSIGTSCAPASTISNPFTTVSSACCPVGYTLSPDDSYCFEINVAAADPIGGSPTIAMHYTDISNYGVFGSVFYKMLNSTTIGYNSDGTWDITNVALYPDIKVYSTSLGTDTPNFAHFTTPQVLPQSDVWINTDASTYNNSRMNLGALWQADSVTCPASTCTVGCQSFVGTLGFSRQLVLPEDSIYYIGIGSDDYGSIIVDGVTIIAQNVSALAGANYFANMSSNQMFRFWHIYPVPLTAGPHIIELSVTNAGGEGAMAMEIYNATLAQLEACHTVSDLAPFIIFSTKDIANCQQFNVGSYDCHTHPGYNLVYDPDTDTYSCQQIVTTATIEC